VDHYYGTSVGALNSLGFALRGHEWLEEQWRGIKHWSDILHENFPVKQLWSTGIYNMKPLRKKLEELVDSVGARAAATVCLVDMVEQGKIIYKSTMDTPRKDMAKWTEASACIPVIMELTDNRYADGGVREQTPLKKAIKDGAESIWVVLASPLTQDLPGPDWELKWPRKLNIALRTVDLMSHEVFLNDMEVCRRKNDMAGYRFIDLRVIAPERTIGDTLDFDPDTISANIAYGAAMAAKTFRGD
jgi:predicted acylesterase/phospholipase RssA